MNLPAIAGSLSSVATQYGAPLASHLWQSTAFAGLVWLLTLLLRKTCAQARYLLWLIASAKFLLPFSLLIGLGRFLAWPGTSAVAQPRLFIAMETIGQPFSLPNPSPVVVTAAPSMWEAALRNLPIFLVMVWLAGCVAVVVMWYLRWQRLNEETRAAVPSKSGREFEALRRTEQSMGSFRQINLILSPSSLEPGILGILRPVLVLPASISGRLTDEQLDSIITHELCHVRRRDNLAAVLHMLVEALFWFHPLVWSIGTRLVEERERACDEEVLRLGADPHVYAESILKVCKFYLEPPLFCAAGVTGSNLKKRIEAIMMNRIAPNLDFGRKLLLSAAGLLAVLVPIAFGFIKPAKSRAESQTQDVPAATHSFQSVSIKPNTSDTPMPGFPVKGKPFSAVLSKPDRFMATNITLQGLIRVAYGVQDSQIAGGPDWLNSEKYDMVATIGSSLVDQLSRVSKEEAGLERGRILQAFLADRFKLTLHRETREVPGYALVIAKGGPKFQQAKLGDTYPNGAKDPQGSPIGVGNIETGPCKLVGQGVPVAALAFDLSQKINSIVVDETKLQGNYDFSLDCHTAFMERPDSLLTVLPEQLGLELNPQPVPVEMLIIDHAERIAGDESSQAQQQNQSVENVQASNASVSPTGSLTCIFADVKYPEGSIIQEGNGPEQLCARVLARGKVNESAQPQYTGEWIHTSAAIRERSRDIVHLPVRPPAFCTPKPSTQSNLCSCEESGVFSENSFVDSASGKLNCKKGNWVPVGLDHAKQATTEEQSRAAQ